MSVTSARPATRPKMRSSTKIFLGFVAVCTAAYFGYGFYSERAVMGKKFAPLEPGAEFNLVGIAPGRGYQIRVANQMAQLVQGENVEFANTGTAEGGAEHGDNKRRIPIKELLASLRGDQVALGRLIMVLNDRNEDETWPVRRVIWKAEDVRKALGGDKALEERLVRDLNFRLDGTPLETFRPLSLDGIILDVPVEVKVNQGGQVRTLTGRFLEPYLPKMMQGILKETAESRNPVEDQVGIYTREVLKIRSGEAEAENLRQSLERAIDPKRLHQYAQQAEQLLSSATVAVTQDHVERAAYSGETQSDGRKRFAMTIDLTDEGRDRLWQYSRGRTGNQLLLIVNGWPIAAPRVRHELSQRELTITQLPDEVLVRTAVETINGKKGS